jgi:hypothetical protein
MSNDDSTSYDITFVDSAEVIGIPRYIMLNVIRDLNEGDVAKEQVDMLTDQLVLQAQLLDKQDSINAGYRKQIIQWKSISDDKDAYLDSYKLQLDKTSRELKKEKQWNNVLKFTQTISTILLIIAL